MDTDLPLVSVVIPAYNRADLLLRAIRSVLGQTYTSLECIVVDDASTDDTERVVRKFTDNRLVYLRHETNRGGAAARNTGIQNASGDHIAFQDSDDEWLPEKLVMQMAAFKEASQSVGVVYSAFVYVRPDGSAFPPCWDVAPPADRFRQTLLTHNFIATPTAVVRRECFNHVGGFDKALPRYQEWELWLRVAKLYDFRCINLPLLRVHFTKESISASKEAKIQAMQIILKKHYADMAAYPDILAKHLFDLGGLLVNIGRFDEGRRYWLRAVRLRPYEFEYVARALGSLFGETGFRRAAHVKRWVRHRSQALAQEQQSA